MPHPHTNPSGFRFHHLRITHANPALLVEFLTFHYASDYSIGIVTRHVDHDVFRAKLLDTWSVGAVEKMSVDAYRKNNGNSLVFIVVVSFLCPQFV